MSKEKIRPNDPCPCGTLKTDGSRLKYKKCCRGQWPPSPEKIARLNEWHYKQTQEEYARFKEAYASGRCYLCDDSFGNINRSRICPHWLLRPDGAGKDEVRNALNVFGLFRTQAFLRWMANQEVFGKNINDLSGEGDQEKLVDLTIKYKNLEWSFSCGKSDALGHVGTSHGADPHFHFQMRIDGRSFFDYTDHHAPLSGYDKFALRAQLGRIPGMRHVFRHGAGMEEVLDAVGQTGFPEGLVVAEDESKAHVRIETMITSTSGDGISGDKILELMEESRRTGKTMSELAEKLEDIEIVRVLLPPDDVPEKASRKKGR